MSIRWKLSLVMVSLSIILVALLFFGIQWSFKQGFLSYVNQQQQQRLEQLATAIATDFGTEDRWLLLKSEPQFWARYLRHYGVPIGGIKMQHQITLRYKDQPIAQQTIQGVSKGPKKVPFVLFDGDETPLFPPREFDIRDMIVAPITIENKTLGYIGFEPFEETESTNRLDTIFMQTQVDYFAIFAGIGVIISILISYILARKLARPVVEMTDRMQDLVKGNYEKRVSIDGTDELATLAQAYNHTATTLQKNRQSQQQWIADISHELRTPVSVIKGELEAMMDGIRPLSVEQLKSLEQELDQLNHLINDLHQLTTSDQGNMSYRFQALDINDVVSQVVHAFSRETDERNMKVSIEKIGLEKQIMGDQQRLTQLFANLMQNTLRYANGAPLDIQIEYQDRLIITWCDHGPGVKDGNHEKLFDRLFREEQSRNRETGGSGLGLAIVKSIVEAHQGTISARANDPSGLIIEIQIPFKKGNNHG